MSELLGKVRDNQSLLIPTDNRELVSFAVSLMRPMGLKRSSGKQSFIDSVLDTIDDFYEDVVQHLKEWQSAAPKLQKDKTEEPVLTTSGAPNQNGNVTEEKEFVSINPSSTPSESGRAVDSS